MGDLLIFKERLAWLEVLGIFIVLCMNVLLVCNKWQSSSKSAGEQNDDEGEGKVSGLADRELLGSYLKDDDDDSFAAVKEG
jgi:drug/metabolite transporter (DMT)-like permease